MVDTKRPETVAVSAVTSRLQKAGLLVARPEFDVDGTDLIVLKSVREDARFCRIQSKYRSARSRVPSPVLIPSRYVSYGFVVFVFIDLAPDEDVTYCFFEKDIRNWQLTARSEYRLAFSKDFRQALYPFALDQERIGVLESILTSSSAEEEFAHIFVTREMYSAHAHQSAGAGETAYLATPIGSIPLFRQRSTGVEFLGPPSPGDPLKFSFDPATSTWSAKNE